ncbi:MAG: serine hydrolase, partial [Candidatus Sumerlaeota bacterium]|nr:serine hydrolase [Candidatus Sumerlaeota bacterium]
SVVLSWGLMMPEPEWPIRYAQDNPPPATGEARRGLAALDRTVRGFVAQHAIPGAAFALMKGGRLLYSRGFGYADWERKRPVEPESRFRIASISKPITAVAILKLVEEGRLRLTDKAFEILDLKPLRQRGARPDPRLHTITIRHLLRHKGGWDRGQSGDPMFKSADIAKAHGNKLPAEPVDIIRYMLGRPLDFAPGRRRVYSNFGYCALGRVIEALSGRGYEEHVREEVLAPLGIRDMRIGRTLPSGRAKGEVKYYARPPHVGPAVVGPAIGKRVPLPYGAWYLEAMDAHGGWIASARDLALFAAAFADPKASPLLSEESIQAMFGYRTDQRRPKQPKEEYRLGWVVQPFGRTLLHWHNGGLAGTSTFMGMQRDGLSWSVVFNTNNASNQTPERAIRPLIREAFDRITKWPE